MTYNSIDFLVFLLLFLTVYYIVPKVWMKQIVIFAGSVYFYIQAGGKSMLAILVVASLLVYVTTAIINRIYVSFDKEKEGLSAKEAAALFATYKKKSKKYLTTSLILLVGFLVYVKAGRLVGWTSITSFKEFTGITTFIAPLGVSYYTFSSVGYMLDVFWRKAKFEKNYFKLLISTTYFPHIVQGPISRYNKLMPQFDKLPAFSYERMCFGLQRLVWGLFKKLVVADRIALYTGTVFASPAEFAGIQILLAVFLAAFELYADFSGCMDIVLGVSEAIGVTLDENFKQPFFSKSAAEFWRRWHMTLGAWFKDYIFLPIAMSPRFMKFTMNVRKKHGARAGQIVSSVSPLVVVWILTGLWHGTGPDYLVWGLYWMILTAIEAVFAPEFKKLHEKLKINPESWGFSLFQMVKTFLYFAIGRMFTVTGSLAGCATLFKQIFAGVRLYTVWNRSIFTHGMDGWDFLVVFVGIMLMMLVDILQQKMKIRETIAKQPLVLRWIIYYGAIILVAVFGMYGPLYNASNFIYGGF